MRHERKDGYPRFRFAGLLVSLILLIALDIVAPSGLAGTIISTVTFLAVTVATVYALARTRWVLRVTLSLGILGVAANAVTLFTEFPALEIVGVLSISLFMFFTASIVLGEVFRARRVTQEQIFGAICSYILIGIAWSGLFRTAYILDPASLHLPDWLGAESVTSGGLMLYFSFVTLTTLGYGDISPVSPEVRTLCWVEATFGQIYLAVLVARLVSLQVSHSQLPTDDG